MSQISLVNVSKQFGDVEVIGGLDAKIENGEFVVIIGPSGCGKSTLLRLIAGLEELSGGEVRIDGKCVNEVPAKDRNVAMVFQSYALYPHMSVADNMGFSLKMAGVARDEVRTAVASTAETLELTPLLDRFPRQLSGGQRQRVAIGRAIVRHPGVFLFDEPLSNLDAALRAQTRLEIAELHRRIGGTSIYVTHDQVEAMTLADRILVLNGGKVEQVGTPMDIYRRPANLFVAEFIGTPRINRLPFVLERSAEGLSVVVQDQRIPANAAHVPAGLREGERLTLGLRPEAVKLAAEGAEGLSATVRHVERLGESSLIHTQVGTGLGLVVRDYEDTLPKPGEVAVLGVDWSQALFFDEAGDLLRATEPGSRP